MSEVTNTESKIETRILVIDDNSQNLQVIGNILRENNYKISVATNGKEALNFVNKKLPDLILLDIMMPEMDGFEVCEKLKADVRSKNIPIIFLTAKTELDDIVKGFQLGGVDYITKPFKKEELLIRIKTHIDLKHSKDIIIEQNERLRYLNQEKSEFLSIAAHDLKNPLSGILLTCSMFDESKNDFSKEKASELFNFNKRAAQQMLQIVVDILDLNAIEEGKLKLNFTPFNIDEQIHTIISNFKRRTTEKNIIFNFNGINEENIITSDKIKIGQVLENLISNAIKFSPFDKNIWICSKKIKNEEHGFFQVRIEIKDEGPGLNEDDKKRLFLRFSKLSARPTNKESSTGLGLSIVKKLVEALNGKIWCESEAGKGATFILEIPEKITSS